MAAKIKHVTIILRNGRSIEFDCDACVVSTHVGLPSISATGTSVDVSYLDLSEIVAIVQSSALVE